MKSHINILYFTLGIVSILILSNIVYAFTYGNNLILNSQFTDVRIDNSTFSQLQNDSATDRSIGTNFTPTIINTIKKVSIPTICFNYVGSYSIQRNYTIRFYDKVDGNIIYQKYADNLVEGNCNLNPNVQIVNFTIDTNLTNLTSFFAIGENNGAVSSFRFFDTDINPDIAFYYNPVGSFFAENNPPPYDKNWTLNESREMSFIMYISKTLPENWFYDDNFIQYQWNNYDLNTWNLSNFNLTNQSLFYNLENAIAYECSAGSPSVFTHNFTLKGNSVYRLQFDIKANLTANETTLCGQPFNSDGIDFFITGQNSGELGVMVLSNGTPINNSGSNILTTETYFYYNKLNNSNLQNLGNGWYRFSGEFNTKNSDDTANLYITNDNAQFFLGSYAYLDNFALQEKIPECGVDIPLTQCGGATGVIIGLLPIVIALLYISSLALMYATGVDTKIVLYFGILGMIVMIFVIVIASII